MIATTPSGGYSYFERIKPVNSNQESQIQAGFELMRKEAKQIKSLTHTRGITEAERLEALNKWRLEEYQLFADQFGFHFENQIGPVNISPTKYIFNYNFIEKFVDKLLLSFR